MVKEPANMGDRVLVPVPSLSCLRLDTATPVDRALNFLQGMLKVRAAQQRHLAAQLHGGLLQDVC